MRGESPKQYAARKAFENSAKDYQHVAQTVLIPVACTCSEKPYAHLYHGEHKARA
jgi:hypothetical protein